MGVNGSEPSNGRAVDNKDNTDKIIDIANDTDIYNILIEWMKLTPALHVLSAKHKTFITASDKNCCTTCVRVKIMIILGGANRSVVLVWKFRNWDHVLCFQMVMGVFVMFSPIFFFFCDVYNIQCWLLSCYYQFIAEVHFLLFLLYFGNLKF